MNAVTDKEFVGPPESPMFEPAPLTPEAENDSFDAYSLERAESRYHERRLQNRLENNPQGLADEINAMAYRKIGEGIYDVFGRAVPRGAVRAWENVIKTITPSLSPEAMTTGLAGMPMMHDEENWQQYQERLPSGFDGKSFAEGMPEPQTKAGEFAEPVAQFFAVGFPAAKALQVAGMGAWASWFVGGGVGDAAAFDPKEELLSDIGLEVWAEEFPDAAPELRESIQESLYFGEDENQMVARLSRRLQMAGEGALLGLLFEGGAAAAKGVATEGGRQAIAGRARKLLDGYNQARDALGNMPRAPSPLFGGRQNGGRFFIERRVNGEVTERVGPINSAEEGEQALSSFDEGPGEFEIVPQDVSGEAGNLLEWRQTPAENKYWAATNNDAMLLDDLLDSVPSAKIDGQGNIRVSPEDVHKLGEFIRAEADNVIGTGESVPPRFRNGSFLGDIEET